MTSNSAARLCVCALAAVLFISATGATSALAARLFGDTFETGTAGVNIGAPWAANQSTNLTATYQTAANPFPGGGGVYGDFIDNSAANSLRLVSNASNDNTLSPNIAGQLSTYSFDFEELGTNEGVGTGFIFGYYRQQANVDLNGAGRSYSGFLHDGNLNPVAANLVSGAAGTYTVGVPNTVFLVTNDSASTVTNDAATGRDLAPTTADVWISLNGAAPSYVFTTSKQNVASGTAVSGIGFRTFTGDQEHMQIDNVLLASGATFDRSSLVAFPNFNVDRDTGKIEMKNTSPFNVTVKGYTLSSVAGSLKPGAGSWNPIADNGDADSGGGFDPVNVWTKTSTVTTQLSESTSGNGGTLVATTGVRDLGFAWARTPYQDLVANYTLSDGSIGSVAVTYSGQVLKRSDLNADGSINATDFQSFLAGTGTVFTGQTKVQSYAQGDLDGDGDNDFADFRLFKADFIAANGRERF